MAYTARSRIVHSGRLKARELEEPVAAQSKKLEPQNKRDQ